MVTLLHISDLHFGRRRARTVSEAVLRAEAELRPDAVVCSGDLVEWSETNGPWREVSAFLRRFTAPLVVTPGNHDIERVNPWNRLVRPLGRYRRFVRPEIDTVTELPGVVVVGLGTPRRWSLHLGHVSRAQLEFVGRAFERAGRGVVRAVALHHGFEAADLGLLREHVWGAGRLREKLLEVGAHVVMSGHAHFPHAERMSGEGGAFVWAQAGTTGSQRFKSGFDPRNSLSLIRASVDRVVVQWWHFAAEHARFVPGRSVELALTPAVAPVPAIGVVPAEAPA